MKHRSIGKLLLAVCVIAALLAGAFLLNGPPAARPDAPDAPAPAQTQTPDAPADAAAPAQPDEPDISDVQDVPAQVPDETQPAPMDEAAPDEQPAAGGTCTISISCSAILSHMDWLAPEKAGLVPADGCLLAATETAFSPGESVFDVLQRVCREQGIHLEFSNTPMYNSAYIEGIGNLYEFDCGAQSGWMYRVNGWFPGYGCSRYGVKDGDVIDWLFTCDYGADVGAGSAAGEDAA